MPRNTEFPKPRRLEVRLSEKKMQDLRDIADSRFGGNMSTTVLVGVQLVELLYADPSTHGARTPVDALARYIHSMRQG